MAGTAMPRKLWEPANPKGSLAYNFMQECNRKRGTTLETWPDLHAWSVDHYGEFWEELFQQHPLIHSGNYTRVVDETTRMDSIPSWFEGVQINYAENVLLWPDATNPSLASKQRKEDHKTALIEVREGATEIRHCTWGELRERTGHLSNALRAHGLQRGDRVAAVASHSIDTLIVFLAVTALGGIFSSSSTDMGTKGVLDRVLQIKPRFIFMDDWALYNGKTFDLRPKMADIIAGMASVSEFKGMVTIPRTQGKPVDISRVSRCQTLASLLRAAGNNKELFFERGNFSDPVVIVYSSGTTANPKCITHGVGGVLLNTRKEGILHRDAGLEPDSCTLQYTTTGWIMYLASIASLINGVQSVFYDGAPFQPDLKVLLRLVQDLRVTDLGISPRYLSTLATAKPPVLPREVVDLSRLKRVSCTGMVLSEAQFEWFYDHAFPPHVQLSNISGGTDLAGCLAMDNPMQPVYSGGCMGPALGIKLEVFDQELEGGKGIVGQPLAIGEAGELVCTRTFPTQPVRFWGDETGVKYHDAYFARFDNVWTHGDFVSVNAQTGGVYFHGRADGVLNPSGVRFGSAEIYNVLDIRFPEEIQDSICVGQRRPQDIDETVLLFLLMRPGRKFSPELARRVKDAISHDCGPRYVPKHIFETPGIPTTINFKKVELPVKQIVSGKRIKPSDTLANKECLQFYYQFVDIENVVRMSSKL